MSYLMAFQARFSRIKSAFAFFPKIDLTPVKMYTTIKTYKKIRESRQKINSGHPPNTHIFGMF